MDGGLKTVMTENGQRLISQQFAYVIYHLSVMRVNAAPIGQITIIKGA